MNAQNKSILIVIFTVVSRVVFAQTDVELKLKDDSKSFWNNLPNPDGWVNDYENLYTEEEERSLDSIISIYKAKSDIEIAIVTLDTNSTTKERFDDLTLHIANTWGVGDKETNNGILIGISKGYRKMRIQNGFGIEKIISDHETKEIIDKFFIPSFKKGDYYQGTLTGLTRLIELLNSKL